VLQNKREKILFDREDINTRVKEMGKIISDDYRDKNLIIVSLLRGSFIFAADLVREINIPVKIDFMTTSSYGHGEQTSGSVRIVNDIRDDVKNADVLIVDDIIDSGLTMNSVMEILRQRGARSVKSCVLLDKPSRRQVNIVPDYCGFSIPDLFIVGYGLNYGDYYRNIPYVFTYED